jgi:hypothetical protein
MLSQRQRPVVIALATLVAIWIVAMVAYGVAKNLKVTPEKVRAYAESVEFGKLSAADRARAIQKLAAMLNALSLEERQRLRLDRTAYAWFEQMTEAEKSAFLEATMPTGFKQMLGAFEELPQEKRKRAVDEAVKRMRETREKMTASGGTLPAAGTNGVALSPELQQQVTTIGLKSFYSESSAQTKAEMAPLLEEMQRMMESGMLMRGGPRR